MRDQSHYETYEASEFFRDGQSARPPLTGTIARGALTPDDAMHTGKSDGRFVVDLPLKVTLPLLERGRQRFDIFCAPCHDYTGSGRGMIVQRGFTEPPSYHTDRLRKAPAGHFFDVITNGFRNMPRYGPQIAIRDRWAIVAYLRALQLSRNARPEDVPQALRGKLDLPPLKEHP